MNEVGRPVLGSVGMFRSATDQAQDKRQRIVYASLAAVCLALQLTWVGWMFMHSARA